MGEKANRKYEAAISFLSEFAEQPADGAVDGIRQRYKHVANRIADLSHQMLDLPSPYRRRLSTVEEELAEAKRVIGEERAAELSELSGRILIIKSELLDPQLDNIDSLIHIDTCHLHAERGVSLGSPSEEDIREYQRELGLSTASASPVIGNLLTAYSSFMMMLNWRHKQAERIQHAASIAAVLLWFADVLDGLERQAMGAIPEDIKARKRRAERIVEPLKRLEGEVWALLDSARTEEEQERS